MSHPSSSSRRWSDLSSSQRTAIIVLGAVQVTLQLAALWDLRKRHADEVRGPKVAWFAASFINFAGPIAYLRWGRR